MHKTPAEATLPRPVIIAGLFVALLGARLLGAHYMYFYQNDEVSLAAGISALFQHNGLSDTYRYGPQVGYHRLVQLIAVLLGGNPASIPKIMITLSAVAGTIIPVCGLALFPAVLSRAERWVLAGLLAINPILWMSSTYGSSTMPATALLVMAVTVLSAPRGRGAEAAALALFGAGVLVRADTILAAPLIGLMLWQRYGKLREVAARVVPLGLGVAVVFAAFIVFDPRMASSVNDVADHLTNRFPTMFWDYLLWSTSPFVFIAAIVGITDLAAARRPLLACLAAWCLPFFAFYYPATTTPRYFIPTVVPLAIAGSVGAFALARLLAPRRTRLAGAVIGAIGLAPLFIGLGWFSPQSWKNLYRESQFETQVGPMWTGAFLFKTYFVPGFLVRSVRNPGFGRLNLTQQALDSSLAVVASGAMRGRTVAVLLGGFGGHSFHYFANVHGAKYSSRAPGRIFVAETWMDLGGARLMSIGRGESQYHAMAQLPLTAGDQIWMLAWKADDERFLRSQVPEGLALTVIGGADHPVRQYALRKAP